MSDETRTREDIFAALAAPFPAQEIQWRVGATTKDGKKGLALAYVDARAVMDRLDDVIGPENWSDVYHEVLGRIVCTLSLRFTVVPSSIYEWTAKSDGAGDPEGSGGLKAGDVAKGGLSDAFKRAAVKWGIGRYLYRLESRWMPLKDGTKQLDGVPTLPTWALPEGDPGKAKVAPVAPDETSTPPVEGRAGDTPPPAGEGQEPTPTIAEEVRSGIIDAVDEITEQYGDRGKRRLNDAAEYYHLPRFPNGSVNWQGIDDDALEGLLQNLIKLLHKLEEEAKVS